MMEAHVGDVMVTGYEHLIETLTLPDPNDRHVLAAAIHGGASVIVTRNLKDFPAAALVAHGITAQHPDTFVQGLMAVDAAGVIAALAADRADLVAPPLTPEEYLDALEHGGLPDTVARLRPQAHLL